MKGAAVYTFDDAILTRLNRAGTPVPATAVGHFSEEDVTAAYRAYFQKTRCHPAPPAQGRAFDGDNGVFGLDVHSMRMPVRSAISFQRSTSTR